VRLGAADPARVTTPLAIGLGLAALAARVPSPWAVAVTAGVGAVGLLAPLGTPIGAPATPSRSTSPVIWLGALALGVAALLIASRLPVFLGLGPHGAGSLIRPAGPAAVGAGVVAAVAEEAFFRRLVYGALLAGGPGVALVGSSVLFAAVHVTVYGAWVLPLDLAAGLLFGWQRQATGSWAVPAATHAVANLLVVL